MAYALASVRIVAADSGGAWTHAGAIKQTLLQAQLALLENDKATAGKLVREAQRIYNDELGVVLKANAPRAAAQIDDAVFEDLAQAVTHNRPNQMAALRGALWPALLRAGMEAGLNALGKGDAITARDWLLLREFRTSTRFQSASANATLALEAAIAGERVPKDAAALVQTELLDTYQFQMNDALNDASKAHAKKSELSRAEAIGLASGYFKIVQGAYAAQFGAEKSDAVQRAFAELMSCCAAVTAAQHDIINFVTASQHLSALLNGFRAAPLSETERNNRAIKVGRYLSLIAPNYGRGVRDENGKAIISNQIEFDEAVTFRKAAEESFNDLAPDLNVMNPQATAQLMGQLRELETLLAQVSAPAQITSSQNEVMATWQTLVPKDWVQSNPSADFDNIRDMLRNVEKAAGAKQFPQAESARLEGYAILDAGPEIRLRGLAPELANELSGLFWQGFEDTPGLLTLISQQADVAQVRATTAKINDGLVRAQSLVGSGRVSPEAVIGNAAVIIFRQGLEAVVIIASIFAGLRRNEDQRFKKPLKIGLWAATGVTLLTWFAMRGLLNQFMQFGERLEAVVSVIGVAVLLLILNWFFHKVYWTGWMAGIHARKRKGIVSAEASQFLALVLVGFTSVYREGFETVLFSQVLVLEAGVGVVLQGLALGAAAVLLVAVLAFKLQSRLPYKHLLVVTGALIGTVLLQMVGQTVHVMQAVRWLPVSPINLPVPYWMGVWFGVYPTWQGIGAQVAAAAFVLGSYFLAERENNKLRVTPQKTEVKRA